MNAITISIEYVLCMLFCIGAFSVTEDEVYVESNDSDTECSETEENSTSVAQIPSSTNMEKCFVSFLHS